MINVVEGIIEAVQYDFILKALLVGSLIAICCSLLGAFLVLKKLSLIGDGLAHVSFASVAIALLFSASPLLISIPMVILASFVILKLNEKADLHGDAAIGLVSSFSIAAGVLIASLANGFNVDLMSYLFGSILVISNMDVIISMVLSALVILMVLLFYNNLFAITYDEEFARVAGLNTRLMNYLIAVLTSITIAIGIRIVGTMLISSLIIFPTVTALQISKGFKGTMVISAVVSVLCVIFGVFLSYLFSLPTGAAIVMLNAAIFLVFFCIKRLNVI
ncbi:MAG: ABC transporter [Clostridiales bacterium GWC2_40_7]|nr:MAG: ABC transporter [Clostridiales bacterium GWC2_40_7]